MENLFKEDKEKIYSERKFTLLDINFIGLDITYCELKNYEEINIKKIF